MSLPSHEQAREQLRQHCRQVGQLLAVTRNNLITLEERINEQDRLIDDLANARINETISSTRQEIESQLRLAAGRRDRLANDLATQERYLRDLQNDFDVNSCDRF